MSLIKSYDIIGIFKLYIYNHIILLSYVAYFRLLFFISYIYSSLHKDSSSIGLYSILDMNRNRNKDKIINR